MIFPIAHADRRRAGGHEADRSGEGIAALHDENAPRREPRIDLRAAALGWTAEHADVRSGRFGSA